MDEKFEQLVSELKRRSPRYPEIREAEARAMVERMGSAEDALLWLEWAERNNQLNDIESRIALTREYEARAKNPRLGEMMRRHLPDYHYI